MEEIWKDIVGYEGQYQVSDKGNVVSLNYRGRKGYRKLMTPSPNEKGYLIVLLTGGKPRYNAKVHRLVAEAFVPNPFGYSEVNHIDGDKANNRKENLEWTDRKGNMSHAKKSGALDNAKKKLKEWNEQWKIPVIAKNCETGAEAEFASITEAAKSLGVSDTKISACLNGDRKTTGGYTFRKVVND